MELYGEERSDSGKLYRRDRIINWIRRIVFNGEANDCTVAESSSYGGLTAPYTSRMENVLHGWAPRYRNVQGKVMQLLTNDGSLFNKLGFPDSYAAERSTPDTWVLSSADAEKESGATSPEKPEVISPAPGSLNLGRLDPTSWSKSGIGGNVEVLNDRLVLSAPGDAGARTFAKSPLKGDFDVSFDYQLTEWKPSATSAPALDIYISATPEIDGGTIQITRADFEDGAAYIFVEPAEVQKEISGMSGKLRVQRVGTKWTVSLWTGSNWELLTTFTNGMGDAYLGFGVNTNGSDQIKVSMRPKLTGG
jgi:hypothetical protein